MCFDEFCYCTSNLSTSTKIKEKEHTKQSNLEQRTNEEKVQSHRRSIRHNQSIDRQEFSGSGIKRQTDRQSIVTLQPIDRSSLKKIDRNNADQYRDRS